MTQTQFSKKERQMYQKGQVVRLVQEEGLDTPPEAQGHLAVIKTVMPYGAHEAASYDVVMAASGEIVYCEEYHLQEAATQVTFNPGDELGGDDLESGYVMFKYGTTVPGKVTKIEGQYAFVQFDQPLQVCDCTIYSVMVKLADVQ